MKRRSITLLLATVLVVALAPMARAQDDEEPVGPGRWIEVEGHGSYLRFDGAGWEPLLGARVALHFPNGLGIGGSAGMTRRSVDIEDETEEGDVLIATGDLLYLLPSVTRANIYGTIGAGAVRFDATETQAEAGVEDITELVIPVGVGILWYNHPGGSWLAVRSEIRDNIIFLRGDSDVDEDNAITNNWEFSVGLALLLGPQ
jgi:opacity protein-like surface antigen